MRYDLCTRLNLQLRFCTFYSITHSSISSFIRAIVWLSISMDIDRSMCVCVHAYLRINRLCICVFPFFLHRFYFSRQKSIPHRKYTSLEKNSTCECCLLCFFYHFHYNFHLLSFLRENGNTQKIISMLHYFLFADRALNLSVLAHTHGQRKTIFRCYCCCSHCCKIIHLHWVKCLKCLGKKAVCIGFASRCLIEKNSIAHRQSFG